MIWPLGTCRSSCYQSCWVWFTFISSYKKFQKFFRGRKWWRDCLEAPQAEARRISKMKGIKSPSTTFPRTAEVRPCEWPCDAFLKAAGIYDDFYYLAENASLTDFLHDQLEQYLLLTNIFVQNFHFHARRSPPSVEFIYMMSLRRCHYMIFA